MDETLPPPEESDPSPEPVSEASLRSEPPAARASGTGPGPSSPSPSPLNPSAVNPSAVNPSALNPSATRSERIAALLQRLIGDDETLVRWAHGWVSRETRLPRLLAARTLDFAALTDQSLVMFSTGFFSRRPRRRVYNTRLDQIFVVDVDVARGRRLRVTSRNGNPLWLELRSTEQALAFADDLVASARPDLP